MTIVHLDVDTQLDFLVPAGALYVPGAEHRIARIAKLNRYASERGIAVVSTMDAHAENDPEFASWPPHCIAGTLGQRKPESTLLPGAVRWRYEAQHMDLRNAPQVLMEKLTTNCFECPNLLPALEQLSADKYVVYGVATDVCVRYALEGLLQLGKKIELVVDGIQAIDSNAGDEVIRRFQAAGGGISTGFA